MMHRASRSNRVTGCWVALVWLVLVCFASPGHADTGKAVEDEAAMLLWWGDLASLETMYSQARQSSGRDQQGLRDIDHLRHAIGRVFTGGAHEGIAYSGNLLQLTERYLASHPNSAFAHLMFVRAMFGSAWATRGGDYANKVPRLAMESFHRQMAQTQTYLADHADLLMSDTTTHLYLLMVGRSVAWEHGQHWAVLEDGLKRDPGDWDLFQEMMFTMLPKWHGSAEDLEMVANRAVASSRAEMGTALYAWTYMTAVYDFKGDFFRSTLATWAKMKKGFEDLLARYPAPENLNQFALVACLAEDQVEAKALLTKIGSQPLLKQWGAGDVGQRMYQSCKKWAFGG